MSHASSHYFFHSGLRLSNSGFALFQSIIHRLEDLLDISLQPLHCDLQFSLGVALSHRWEPVSVIIPNLLIDLEF